MPGRDLDSNGREGRSGGGRSLDGSREAAKREGEADRKAEEREKEAKREAERRRKERDREREKEEERRSADRERDARKEEERRARERDREREKDAQRRSEEREREARREEERRAREREKEADRRAREREEKARKEEERRERSREREWEREEDRREREYEERSREEERNGFRDNGMGESERPERGNWRGDMDNHRPPEAEYSYNQPVSSGVPPKEKANGKGSLGCGGCLGIFAAVFLGMFAISCVISFFNGVARGFKVPVEDKQSGITTSSDKTSDAKASAKAPAATSLAKASIIVDGVTYRQSLPEECVHKTKYYQDDRYWVLDSKTFTKGLRYFYEKTGIQPFIMITDDIGVEDPTQEDLEKYCDKQYDKRFDDEGHIFFLYYSDYFGDDTRMWAVCGTDASQIMDDEAWDILFDNVEDCYYDEDYEDDEIFGTGFMQTADDIMIEMPEEVAASIAEEPAITTSPVTVSPEPIVSEKATVETEKQPEVKEKTEVTPKEVIGAIILVALVIALIVWIWKRIQLAKEKKRKQEQQEAEDLEKILSVPLEKFSDKDTADELQDLMDKYDNVEDAEEDEDK